MLNHIQTIHDVVTFAKQLVAEGTNFHPDDDFNEYISIETNLPSYTSDEAKTRNRLMEECFEICEKEGVDIYDLMQETTLRETGMDQMIPLP